MDDLCLKTRESLDALVWGEMLSHEIEHLIGCSSCMNHFAKLKEMHSEIRALIPTTDEALVQETKAAAREALRNKPGSWAGFLRKSAYYALPVAAALILVFYLILKPAPFDLPSKPVMVDTGRPLSLLSPTAIQALKSGSLDAGVSDLQQEEDVNDRYLSWLSLEALRAMR